MKCPICHKQLDHFTIDDFSDRDIPAATERVAKDFYISLTEAMVFVHMWDKHFLNDVRDGCKCGYVISHMKSTWEEVRDHIGDPPIDHWIDIVLGAV